MTTKLIIVLTAVIWGHLLILFLLAGRDLARYFRNGPPWRRLVLPAGLVALAAAGLVLALL